MILLRFPHRGMHMTRVKTFFISHRRFFCIFAFLVFYNLVFVRSCTGFEISTVGYSFLALDYSLGFASGLLPGAVFRLLCGEIDNVKATLFAAGVYLAILIAVAAFLEKLLLAAKKEDRRSLWILLLFFIAGPNTFALYFTQIGTYEVYWVFLAALFLLCLAYRPLTPLTVPVCVLTLLVNWNGLFCVVPFFCILLLYRFAMETKTSAKTVLGICFALCVGISVPLAVYLVLCVPGNLRYTLEEFHALMLQKGVTYFHYPDTLLYHTTDRFMNEYFASLPETEVLLQSGPWTYLTAVIRAYYSIAADQMTARRPWQTAGAVLAAAPVVFLTERFFRRGLRDHTQSRLKRFCFFCMGAMFFVTLLITAFTAFDYFKWLSIAYIFLFASFLFVAYHEKQRASVYLNGFFAGVPAPCIIAFAVAYAALALDIYF